MTDGSIHTAQRTHCVDRKSCARLGQRRQSPCFASGAFAEGARAFTAHATSTVAVAERAASEAECGGLRLSKSKGIFQETKGVKRWT